MWFTKVCSCQFTGFCTIIYHPEKACLTHVVLDMATIVASRRRPHREQSTRTVAEPARDQQPAWGGTEIFIISI